MSKPKYLLDTCALLYLAFGETIKAEAMRKLGQADVILVSPISAWELGRLASLGRLKSTMQPLQFFHAFVFQHGITLSALSDEILVAASFLPELNHKDPWDQILIATARLLDFTLVTSDRAILAYGSEGHVKTLSC
jgi:PIN domain nuclease of toxin-antitoxin system